MLRYRSLSLLFVLSLLLFQAKAQPKADPEEDVNEPTEPKREFRGVWIATVVNIDWPANMLSSPEKQRKELIELLDYHERTGINAVMLQVRPAADALYAKSFEPWSKYLTGQQGKAPSPQYDPLEFAIEEAHSRGMELHAWFNPYRATFDKNFNALSSDHITKQRPEWFFTYGGIKLFNPGIPEVREYIVKVILNVVDNYDIDGVHLDDYFYPYIIPGQRLNDEETYNKYGSGFSNIKDWRRDNVDKLIQMIGDSVKSHKPRVKFGISPFGIWANKGQNVEGSATAGGSSYYENFADSRKWIREGWIDYINPQLYWPISSRAAGFKTLVDWWSNNANNRHLYIGMAPYRILERKAAAFRNPSELPDQINYLRNNPRVQGSVYFSSNSLYRNPMGFSDSLRNNYYRYKALPPVMIWRDSIAPNPPRNITIRPSISGVFLNWQAPLPATDNEPVYGYVIYRFEDNEKINTGNPKNILHIQYGTNLFYQDKTAVQGENYLYVVTAIDRLKNESERSPAIAVSN